MSTEDDIIAAKGGDGIGPANAVISGLNLVEDALVVGQFSIITDYNIIATVV